MQVEETKSSLLHMEKHQIQRLLFNDAFID